MLMVGTIALALSVGHAEAKSDKESCKETVTGTVENTNADGTQCAAEVGGSGSNKATATAVRSSFCCG